MKKEYACLLYMILLGFHTEFAKAQRRAVRRVYDGTRRKTKKTVEPQTIFQVNPASSEIRELLRLQDAELALQEVREIHETHERLYLQCKTPRFLALASKQGFLAEVLAFSKAFEETDECLKMIKQILKDAETESIDEEKLRKAVLQLQVAKEAEIRTFASLTATMIKLSNSESSYADKQKVESIHK